MSGPIRQPLADVTTVTPTLNDKAVTIQAGKVRTSLYSAIYNLFKTGFDAAYLTLTGGTMSGNINMDGSKVRGLGEPSADEDATPKLYVDEAVATKQDAFDYSGAATGATTVTINGVKGGVATFTQTINPRNVQYFRINSNQITATSKIIAFVIYDGNGYPLIVNQRINSTRVDILVTNADVLGNGGAVTNANIVIQYQIVG
jgi:hypothetical protein